ncbi:MAG: TIM barrel protein [Candidatus Aenigmarchaeota archaeon]|nr:TIM barrel protein [Candidatus Aenigmarchaeota archaeon]
MTHVLLGPAGICVTAKEKTTIGSLRRVAELQLSAQEVEYVRGVNMSVAMAREVGKVARELGIELSVHCPYYVNLCSVEKKKIEDSKKRILDSAERANAMGAKIIVFHPGYYGKLLKNQALDLVKNACLEIAERIERKGWDVSLGLETTGKISAVGTVEEIVNLCEEIKNCTIVLDPAHIFARNAGRIDYKEMFDKIKPLKLKHINMHFSGIKFSPVKATGYGNEISHLPIEVNAPPFEPLAKEILKRKIDVTIISESPVLEKDSLVMKEIFEKLGYRF